MNARVPDSLSWEHVCAPSADLIHNVVYGVTENTIKSVEIQVVQPKLSTNPISVRLTSNSLKGFWRMARRASGMSRKLGETCKRRVTLSNDGKLMIRSNAQLSCGQVRRGHS